MPISQKELGRRLRAAREACRMTQDDVARHLQVSRSTVAQMELGNRGITGLELDRLAYLFGRDMREFFTETFNEEDVLVVLFRAHPDVIEQEEVVEALRRCLALGREATSLERLLGLDGDQEGIAAYPLPTPRSKWEAVSQGTRVSEEERRRLGLGIAPLVDIGDILEAQSVHTILAHLPEDISGFTLSEASVGIFVMANRRHSYLRQRFSFAHEYAHVLLDRERRGTISRSSARDELIEVRANAFAAHFLMPEAGVRQLIAGLGKGATSRQQAEVFDESGVVRALSRARPGSQDLQMYDVAQLAHHFGVSRLAALYQLHNLGLLTKTELDHLRAQEGAGVGKKVATLMELPEPDPEKARNTFQHRFLGLGLEALRQGEITRAKLEELAQMVEIKPGYLSQLLREMELNEDEIGDVLIPQG